MLPILSIHPDFEFLLLFSFWALSTFGRFLPELFYVFPCCCFLCDCFLVFVSSQLPCQLYFHVSFQLAFCLVDCGTGWPFPSSLFSIPAFRIFSSFNHFLSWRGLDGLWMSLGEALYSQRLVKHGGTPSHLRRDLFIVLMRPLSYSIPRKGIDATVDGVVGHAEWLYLKCYSISS